MRDDGSLSVFAAILALLFVVVAGLVLDGGRLLSARREAYAVAGAAARAGAQQLDTAAVRAGRHVLDPAAAQAAATAHLATTGRRGTATTTTADVTVTVAVPVPMRLLTVVGVRARTVEATARASAVPGVATPRIETGP